MEKVFNLAGARRGRRSTRERGRGLSGRAGRPPPPAPARKSNFIVCYAMLVGLVRLGCMMRTTMAAASPSPARWRRQARELQR